MFQRRELPFVFINGAVSLDGKLALENLSQIQFSSARDRRFVFQLRASAGVVDEIHVTICPLVLRGKTAPTLCDGEGVADIEDATRLKLKSVKEIEGELFLTYDVLTHRSPTAKRARYIACGAHASQHE